MHKIIMALAWQLTVNCEVDCTLLEIFICESTMKKVFVHEKFTSAFHLFY